MLSEDTMTPGSFCEPVGICSRMNAHSKMHDCPFTSYLINCSAPQNVVALCGAACDAALSDVSLFCVGPIALVDT